ncbi:hypothetical protein T458_07195 [Brevibacillus panacihumi W25]|uniref:Uncharacterized protein n=1 Tax=Brevibacillus panacihumi W25 TaxID=1408254 RepID=V6MBU5_9BACL|nr:hypothetical protein [Brevibacillus panacihumi]EST55702.1 hypothetical protein T458_07195 [Brevibacillus panacihumi W25]
MLGDMLVAGVQFDEVDSFCKKNFSNDFRERIRMIIEAQIQSEKPFEVQGEHYYITQMKLYNFSKSGVTEGEQITEELVGFIATLEKRRMEIRNKPDQYKGYGRAFLREIGNWLNHHLPLGKGVFEMLVVKDAVWLMYRIKTKDIASLGSTSGNAGYKPESSLSVIYQERYDDMGVHGTHHNRYYAVTATMEGYSGIIELSFRSEKFANGGAGEGYLEGITYEWGREGAVKQLHIYSKKRLLSPDDEPVNYKGFHCYPYQMPADIMNPKEFYCYNPDGYMGNSSIEIRELFQNMKEYYKKIFKITPKQNDLLSFKSPNGDDLRDEGIGYGFKIYT